MIPQLIPLMRTLSTGRPPSLDLNFLTGTLDSRIDFTRGSQATLFDSTGTLVYAPNNVIRNNTMVGAVAGTPGTTPTNWTQNVIASGLTRTIVGTGITNGITWIDIQFQGTTSNANGYALIFETTTGVAATSGQTWTASTYFAISGGSTANITNINSRITERDGAGSALVSADSPISVISSLSRFTQTRTLTNASTAFVASGFSLTIPSGVAIDITLRIGMPQLERGSVATAVNATSGTAYYGPRFDYDPSTLAARGLLIEEARTNSIRNNTMQGAVAGTPGTQPTNWNFVAGTTGIASEIVGAGTANGIAYIDIRYSGTAAATSSFAQRFETGTSIAALTGQTWAMSTWAKVQAGSTNGITAINHQYVENTNVGGFVTSGAIAITVDSNFNRQTTSRTLTGGATVAFLSGGISVTVTSGQAIDITLRIGLPQLELGAFATSVIPTTTTALTRSADVASMTGTNFSSWYNAVEGTLFANWTSFIPSGVSPGLTYAAGFTDNPASTGAAQLVIQNRAVSNQIRVWQSTTGGGLDDSIVLTTTTFQGKAAAVYGGAANVTASANGGAVVTMVNPIQTTIFNALTVGAASGTTTTSGILNGHIQRISYYPSRLADSQLQALTA